ncbi:MAG: hypothetical protein CTY36_14065 [Methylocystis sp.]|nr:MAG: hypothetical protein CTY36_14065 [Methylocystis sp.]
MSETWLHLHALNPNMRLTDSLGSATHLRIHILRNCHIAFARLSGGANIENRSAAALTEAGGGENSCSKAKQRL